MTTRGIEGEGKPVGFSPPFPFQTPPTGNQDEEGGAEGGAVVPRTSQNETAPRIERYQSPPFNEDSEGYETETGPTRRVFKSNKETRGRGTKQSNEWDMHK